VKHAGREYEEMGSCCGIPGEITCESGYELVAPIPDVCGGDCPENWCNHHNPNSPLRMARSYKCVPPQNNEGRYPTYPDDFTFSHGAKPTSYECLDIVENSRGWGTNHFCWKDDSRFVEPGFSFFRSGGIPSSGARCTLLENPADGKWSDNYLCVPNDSPYRFEWSCDGDLTGSSCINWNDPDNSIFDNCYLCLAQLPTETSPHEQLKAAVKAAFDSVKSPENKKALPGLIRKAFHDAGHFDKTSGDVRMGCIQNFLSNPDACPQHKHLEDASSVVNAVMNEIPSNMVLSMADAVQLLGALAVDELAQGTGAAPLYDRVRTGRLDPTAETCIDDIHMCNNLPDFFTEPIRPMGSDDHQLIVDTLNDVWVSEIEGKMMNVNTLSKQDAVALIGAHTVGRHFDFGHWTQQPNRFDNEYFLELKRVKNWLDSGKSLGEGRGHPFSKIAFPNWFADFKFPEDPEAIMSHREIMMLDADLALVLNAPELVEKYAADNKAWRRDFDDAYIVMGELGFSSLDPPREGSNRRLLQRSEELLDEDFEFFQNLQIQQEEQRKKFHAAFKGKF